LKASVIFLFVSLLFISCSKEKPFQLESRDNYKVINEHKVLEIKLEGETSIRDAELSGLAWYKNNLILLPQFPYKFGNGINGAIFYLPKQKIKRYINSKSYPPLMPQKLTVVSNGLEKFNWWGCGYEGIIFDADTVYVVLENYKEETEGFIVKGKIDFLKKKIKLDGNSLKKIEINSNIENLSEETVTYFKNHVYAIHEDNGVNVNTNPVAAKFRSNLTQQELISFPQIEYRITDATSVASDSTFWAINYLWQGDINDLKPQSDSLFIKYGIGKTHKESRSVERLIKLKIFCDEIKLVDRQPIYLKLSPKTPSRNWEGLAKLDNLGFLLVTDKFPKTILGFVKYP